MPRRKTLLSTRRSKRSDAQASAALAYVLLFFLAIALVQMLLPFLILGAVLWGAIAIFKAINQQQEEATLTAQHQQERLNATLYQLIQTHQGRVSILDFSMMANVPSEQAKGYLDQKAKEFMANFEATDTGDVLYVFPSSLRAPVAPLPVDTPAALPQPPRDRPTALNQADLARRLNLSDSAISRKKYAPDFAEWSQDRDPHGWAWHYDADRKLFYPLK